MKTLRRAICSRSDRLFTIAVCVLSLCATASGQITVAVYGQSNIYGSGYAVAPDPGGGGGGVLPTLVNLSALPGATVTFPAVTGWVGCCGGSLTNGPDGKTGLDSTNISEHNGISGVQHNQRAMFLVGVFLDASLPTTPAPPTANYTNTHTAAQFTPLLQQVFFVGDGLTGTGSGSVQAFTVPTGATRLFLGFADGWSFQGLPGWYGDNGGALQVTVQGAGAIADYQVNTPLASMTINGVAGTPYVPATATVPINGIASLHLVSSNLGQVWDLALGLAPLVPATTSGWVTADNQILNVDITDPTMVTLFDLFQSPPFVDVTLTFSLPIPASLSSQMVIVAPYMPSGLAFSQPTRLIVQ